MHSVVVDLYFGDSAEKIYESLKPELQAVIPGERSRVGLEISGGTLRLKILAEDIVSLRAAVNTWLRLVRISEDMLNSKVIT